MPWSKDPTKTGKQGRPRTRANKPGAGRPTKFNEQLSKDFCDCLRVGATITLAAAYVKVAPETVHRWINEGIMGKDEQLAEFVADVEAARAAFIVNNLKGIQQAGKGNHERAPNWIARAWLLERCVPGQPYAIQKTRLEVEDMTVRDQAIKQAEQAALQDRIADCPFEHPVIEVECKTEDMKEV